MVRGVTGLRLGDRPAATGGLEVLIIVVLALGVGFVGAWIYAGCPLPKRLSRAISVRHAKRPAEQAPSVPLSPARERDASPARF
jgi:hypothetical protein